jgi:uncharacterized phiE125 gp8 family phage protein
VYVVTTPPAVEPVTVADAKLYCHVDQSVEDSLFTSLIVAARDYVEKRSKRTLITTTYRLDAYGFGSSTGCIRIDKGPLIAVSSIQYYDTAGTLTTVTSSNYRVDITPLYGEIVPIDSYVWPVVQAKRPNAVQIAFTAGYGAAATSVPDTAKTAIKMLVANWYENREPVSQGSMGVVPFAVDALIGTFAAPEFY